MAAMTSIVLKEVKDITECPICTEMFCTPKMLPCFHTFCLKCMEQYCEDKEEHDTMPCPMCRKEFIVPIGGLSKLSVNFFVERLIAAQSASRTNEVVNCCDVCLAGKQCRVQASFFCVECQESMCDPCSNMHKSMKMSMNHHLSTIEDPSSMEANKNKIRQAILRRTSERRNQFLLSRLQDTVLQEMFHCKTQQTWMLWNWRNCWRIKEQFKTTYRWYQKTVDNQ